MAKSILEYVIRFAKEGNADKETVKSLANLKKGTRDVMGFMRSLTGVALGVTGAFYTFKKGFDLAKEGAQLEFTQDKFDRLAVSIGTTSDALKSDLQDATKGLYSNAELVASATDLMSLGLAKTKDEAVRLASVSAGLNMNMNQLVLTLTNRTTMRFDALNVSTDGFNERLKALQATGMSVDAAFKEAFLQQAEEQLAKVGEAADSDVAKFMRMEVAWKNMGDTGKMALADLVVAQLDLRDAMAEAEKAGFTYNRSRMYAAVMKGMTDAASDQRMEIAQLAGSYDKAHFSQQNFTSDMQEMSSATETFSMSLDTVKAAISGPILQAQEDYQTKMRDLNAELASLREQETLWSAPPEGSKKYDELQSKIGEVEQKIKDTTAAYKEQARQISFNIAQEQILASSLSAEQQAQAVSILGQSMGMWDQQTADAITRQAEWTKQLEEGTITMDAYAARTNAAAESTFGITTAAEGAYSQTIALKVAEDQLSGTFIQTQRSAMIGAEGLSVIREGLADAKMQAATGKEQVDGFRNQIGKLDGMEATATINIRVNGSIPDLSGANRTNERGRGYSGYRSGGGQLIPGQWTLVGDMPGGGLAAYSELITPNGYVLDARTSRKLLESGAVVVGKSMVMGGSLSGDYIHPVTGHTINPTQGHTSRRIRGTAGSGAVSVAAVTRAGAGGGGTNQTMTEPITPLVQVTEKAVTSVQAAQVTQTVEARQTRAQQAAQSKEMAGLLRENNRLLQRFISKMGVEIKSAVAQGKP